MLFINLPAEGEIEKVGGKSLGQYYTMGSHDFVAIVEAPCRIVHSTTFEAFLLIA